MKIILLRALTTVMATILLALTYPVFVAFGLSDKVFVIASLIAGSLMIWFTLDVLEPQFKAE